MRLAAVVVLMALAGLVAAPGAMAATCPRASLGDIEDEVMCPVCGTPLELAQESPQAQRERAFIERLIAACRTKGQIKTALVAQFGDRVLALPGDEGGKTDLGDVLIYVIPVLVALLALVGIGFAVRRWRGKRTEDRGQRSEALDERVDEDMERYEL